MHERRRDDVPAGLSRLERRFSAWRKSRVPGERIPAPLWKAAARLAVDYGLSQTATVLKLDYYSLQKRLDEQGSGTASQAAFVELPSAPIAPANECIIEFEDGMGASMRLHWKGAAMPDVLALGRSFWNG